MFCSCKGNGMVEVIGLCDVSTIDVLTNRTWTQISIPEVLRIPRRKPDIESIEKVFENVQIISKRIVDTPCLEVNGVCAAVENQEGTRVTGKKLVIEGILKQKIIYTADKPTQPVHSAEFDFPFSAFIVVAPTATEADEFFIDVCVEDVFIKVLNARTFFKNVTVLLNARQIVLPS